MANISTPSWRSWNSRRKVPILPVWQAPVSTTTGRVCADLSGGGSISRGIHPMLNVRRDRIFCNQVQLAPIVAMVTACD